MTCTLLRRTIMHIISGEGFSMFSFFRSKAERQEAKTRKEADMICLVLTYAQSQLQILSLSGSGMAARKIVHPQLELLNQLMGRSLTDSPVTMDMIQKMVERYSDQGAIGNLAHGLRHVAHDQTIFGLISAGLFLFETRHCSPRIADCRTKVSDLGERLLESMNKYSGN